MAAFERGKVALLQHMMSRVKARLWPRRREQARSCKQPGSEALEQRPTEAGVVEALLQAMASTGRWPPCRECCRGAVEPLRPQPVASTREVSSSAPTAEELAEVPAESQTCEEVLRSLC